MLVVIAMATAGVVALAGGGSAFWLCIPGALLACSTARTRRRALAPSLADCEIIRAHGNKRLGAVAGIIHRLTTGREEPLESP